MNNGTPPRAAVALIFRGAVANPYTLVSFGVVASFFPSITLAIRATPTVSVALAMRAVSLPRARTAARCGWSTRRRRCRAKSHDVAPMSGQSWPVTAMHSMLARTYSFLGALGFQRLAISAFLGGGGALEAAPAAVSVLCGQDRHHVCVNASTIGHPTGRTWPARPSSASQGPRRHA
jgi:hypothetical protein